MAKRTCSVCGTLITKSALPKKSLCRRCYNTLSLRVTRLLSAGVGRLAIKRSLQMPDHLAKAFLRSLGLYDAAWISNHVGSVSTLTKMRFPGIKESFDNEQKNRDRALIFESARRFLGDRQVRLLALPHTAMICYVQAASCLYLIPTESLIVERNRLIFNHISSWVHYWRALAGGEIFHGLRTFCGPLSEALVQVPGTYNLINLDFNGPWTDEVEVAIHNLFAFGRVADKALLCITLAESTRWVNNPTFPRVKKLHRHSVVEMVKESAAPYGYTVRYWWHHGYKRGTTYPMLTTVFQVKKKASSVS